MSQEEQQQIQGLRADLDRWREWAATLTQRKPPYDEVDLMSRVGTFVGACKHGIEARDARIEEMADNLRERCEQLESAEARIAYLEAKRIDRANLTRRFECWIVLRELEAWSEYGPGQTHPYFRHLPEDVVNDLHDKMAEALIAVVWEGIPDERQADHISENPEEYGEF